MSSKIIIRFKKERANIVKILSAVRRSIDNSLDGLYKDISEIINDANPRVLEQTRESGITIISNIELDSLYFFTFFN